MNERIRELINESTSFKEGLIEGKYDIEVFDKEKFAELIVRECANMAKSFHHHQYDFTGNLELHEFIKEHFRIEQ
jgi:DNA-binding transcriptional MocR family regulator